MECESGTLVANSLRQLKGGGCNMQGGEATGAVDDGNNKGVRWWLSALGKRWSNRRGSAGCRSASL